MKIAIKFMFRALAMVLSSEVIAAEYFSIKNLISAESDEVTVITLDCLEGQGKRFVCEPIVYYYTLAPNTELQVENKKWQTWAEVNKKEAESRIYDSIICKEIRKNKKEVDVEIEMAKGLNKNILSLRSKQCDHATLERGIEINKLEEMRNQRTCRIRGPAILAKWEFAYSRENYWTSSYLSSCGYTYVYGLTKNTDNNTWTLMQNIVGDMGEKESELCKVGKNEVTYKQDEFLTWRDMPLYVNCEYLDFVNF